jgi:hypothetical protein
LSEACKVCGVVRQKATHAMRLQGSDDVCVVDLLASGVSVQPACWFWERVAAAGAIG